MALHRIGDAYLAGQGVPLDPETGFLWYLRAANYGLGTAMLRIAVLYLDGVGVAPDISESYRWAWTVNAAARVDAQINRDYVGMSQQTVDASYRRMADPIYDLLTEQDKEAAQERARAWKPTPYPPLD